MKVGRKETKFTPVTITLETEEELLLFTALISKLNPGTATRIVNSLGSSTYSEDWTIIYDFYEELLRLSGRDNEEFGKLGLKVSHPL